MIEMKTTPITAQTGQISKSTTQTVELGNNEQVTCGLVQIATGFLALTFTSSKQYKTRAGAARWLAKRGIFVS
jgi:hypothetical protein